MVQTRYFATSLDPSGGSAMGLLRLIRGHWCVETNLHYEKDRWWDEDRHVFARRDFWGVGNGWTAAGLTRVIRTLPPGMDLERARLTDYTRDLIDACLAYLRPDGLFHNVVDDPGTFVETNLAQMLAYSIYRGLQPIKIAATKDC